MAIEYRAPDRGLSATDFLDLVQRVWPGNYDPAHVDMALRRTINATAWDGPILIGSARVLTDGYFFGTIPEVLVDPAYRRLGIGRRLMELVWEISPTSLFFGAQPGNEPFFEKLGYRPSMASFIKRKPRPAASEEAKLPPHQVK